MEFGDSCRGAFPRHAVSEVSPPHGSAHSLPGLLPPVLGRGLAPLSVRVDEAGARRYTQRVLPTVTRPDGRCGI